MRLGIDIGSRCTKIAYYGDNGELVLKRFDSANFYRKYGKGVGAEFCISWNKIGLPADVIAIATGYGRERARLAGAAEFPEIQAHSAGARHLLHEDTFTLADLGGQDMKVARIENGHVVDFFTSDRCAASTGRFLENMARIIGMTNEELANHWKNPVEISSTCAVFAETELLEKLSQGISPERLAAGVNYAVVKKFVPLIRRFPIDLVIATGGVSQSDAIINLLRDEAQIFVKKPDFPQFAGAIGCLTMTGV
jgi:predicted CoA-substrate-specific enzyme activase